MVRIRVIHASRLLAVLAAALLALVLAVLAISSVTGTARSASNEKAAQAVAAFSFWTPPPMEYEFLGKNGVQAAAEETMDAEPAVKRRVLIYHTHTHEAYLQTEDDPYEETENWRTEDQTHSVVRVGEVLSELLSEHGFDVVHDTADYEYPRLNTAYVRSLEMLESRRGEAFDLCIDLHRDAWDDRQAECAMIGTQRAAQLMMLVGNGSGFEEQPDYAANLSFATRLTDSINHLNDGLCRPVMIKEGRYNQHVFTPSLIIEVGHNLNTLEEALASMSVLAGAIADLLNAA